MKHLAAVALLLATRAAQAPPWSSVAIANGFEVRETVTLVVPPAEALRRVHATSGWWNKEHTYSGNSANLSLDARPGGCFCERFPKGGGIEHMRVAYVEPGKRS